MPGGKRWIAAGRERDAEGGWVLTKTSGRLPGPFEQDSREFLLLMAESTRAGDSAADLLHMQLRSIEPTTFDCGASQTPKQRGLFFGGSDASSRLTAERQTIMRGLRIACRNISVSLKEAGPTDGRLGRKGRVTS
jgi:hypothetical protein